jgi:hypothetical protein
VPASPAVTSVAEAVRDMLARRSFGLRDAEQLIGSLPGIPATTRAQALEAVPFVFGARSAPPANRSLHALATVVSDHFEEPIDLGALLTAPTRLGRAARDVFAAMTFVLALWIVIGGLLTGQSALLGDEGPVASLAAFGAALLVLGLLEAAHIGAASLAAADVSALATTHPRLQRLHCHIDTKEKLEHYLGARQLGVVLVVFVIAEVTRFSGLETMPGTTVAIPDEAGFLLHIGAPGALVVLAIAQVAPQVIAAQQPAGLMNNPVVAGAFYGTLALGKLGLAKPGAWLVAAFRRYERIPSAPRVRFESTTRDVDRHGIVTVRRHLTVGEVNAALEAETAVEFHEGAAVTSYVDSTLTVAEQPTTLSMRSVLRRGEEVLPTVPGELEDERLPGGALRVRCGASPIVGAFGGGDTLATTLHATFDERPVEDVVVIDRPVHAVLMRVRFDAAPVPFPPATLTTARIGEGGLTDLRDPTTQAIAPTIGEDGTVELAATVLFPEPGTVLRLAWAVAR